MRKDPAAEFEFHYRQFLLEGRPETAERVLEDLAATPPETLVASLEASMGYPALASLKKMKAPVLTLSSPLNDLPDSLPRRRRDLPVQVLRGVSHWLMIDRPAQVNRAIEEFVADVG